MDKVKKIQNYVSFFNDQVKELEQDQKSIILSPICQLLVNEDIIYGYIDHVNTAKGHVVLKFPKDKAPRLKVLMSITIIKKKAYTDLGAKISNWNCSFHDFCRNEEYHSYISELMPLYYIRRKDSLYDYVGCSSVSVNLFEMIKKAVENGKVLSSFVFSPFPPVDYFKNLNDFMENNLENDELQIEPKIAYHDWHPEELAYNPENNRSIVDALHKTLNRDKVCILQGPPGTGKSYTIAQILAEYLKEGKTACVTTMANKGLIELVKQEPLKFFLKSGKISKTNLSADEKQHVSGIKKAPKGLAVSAGELVCSTNYVLSKVFSRRNLSENGLPLFDIIVIEEASQAFLSAIIAFKSLGKKCMIVGDPMQLPPIISNPQKSIYSNWNVSTQVDGLKTIALGTNIKAFRITTTFRLTPKSAALTSIFYDNSLTSVQKEAVDYSKIHSKYFPAGGGVIYHCTKGSTNSIYSNAALGIISDIIEELSAKYPKRSLAIISPFKDTVRHLQKNFLTDTSIGDFTIETIDRIQGMTVDYAILYFPLRDPGFALDERRFNVATSRSRSTTLIISDIPLTHMHSITPSLERYLALCKHI